MKSYSMDIRKRVIDYREDDYSTQEVADLLCLSTSTVKRYWRRYNDEGNCECRQRGGYKRSKLEGHDEELKKWISNNSSITLEELRKQFQKKLGIKVSIHPIWKRLKDLGISYKKNDLGKGAKS